MTYWPAESLDSGRAQPGEGSRLLRHAAARGREPLLPAVVLLVEDDPGDQFLAQEAFEAIGFPCDLRIVSDGQEALDYLHHKARFQLGAEAPRPDLVLLDLNMPRMNGQQAAREIHADPCLADIPIIVLTNSLRRDDILHAYGQGVISYIRKPLGLGQFNQVLGEIETFLKVILSMKQLRSSPRLTERQVLRLARRQRQFEQRAENLFNQYMGQLVEPPQGMGISNSPAGGRGREPEDGESLLRLAQRILKASSINRPEPAGDGSSQPKPHGSALSRRGRFTPEPDIASLCYLAQKLAGCPHPSANLEGEAVAVLAPGKEAKIGRRKVGAKRSRQK